MTRVTQMVVICVAATATLATTPLTNAYTITKITDNVINEYNPVISGSSVAWQGHDGNDQEIYFTTIPEPATVILLAMGLLSLHGSRGTRTTNKTLNANQKGS